MIHFKCTSSSSMNRATLHAEQGVLNEIFTASSACNWSQRCTASSLDVHLSWQCSLLWWRGCLLVKERRAKKGASFAFGVCVSVSVYYFYAFIWKELPAFTAGVAPWGLRKVIHETRAHRKAAAFAFLCLFLSLFVAFTFLVSWWFALSSLSAFVTKKQKYRYITQNKSNVKYLSVTLCICLSVSEGDLSLPEFLSSRESDNQLSSKVQWTWCLRDQEHCSPRWHGLVLSTHSTQLNCTTLHSYSTQWFVIFSVLSNSQRDTQE